MPPSTKNAATTAPAKPKQLMPTPPAIVAWSNAPGGEKTYAMVTKVGRSAISVLVFPPDSRAGTPKDSVRYIGDPLLKSQLDSDSGVWDYTDETKALRILAQIIIPDNEGFALAPTPEMFAFVNRVIDRPDHVK